MRKILMTICTFLLISLSALCAVGSNYKNTLLSVDVIKTAESSYDIVLNTQSPYAEPIKVIRKSDYDYYILLPETYSLIPESSSNSDIKNFSVQLFPYAGQSGGNGYTKITILTVRPLNFSTSIKSIDKNTPTKSDLDRIAKLNALDNNANQVRETKPKTAAAQPQKQKSQVSKQTTQTQPAKTQPKTTKPQTQPVKTQPQAQKPVQSAPTAKVSNPINVSSARKDNIRTYNTAPQNTATAENNVKPKETTQVAKQANVKPASNKVQKPAPKASKPKAKNVQKTNKVAQKPTPVQTTPKPQVQEEVRKPVSLPPEAQKPVQTTEESQKPSSEQKAIGSEVQSDETNVTDFRDAESLELEEEPASNNVNGIISKLNRIIAKIPLSRSNIIIGILSFIIFVMFIALIRKPKKQQRYENVPQNVNVQYRPETVEVSEEIAPNTYIEQPDINEPIIEDYRTIEPNIPKQTIEEPEVINQNVIQPVEEEHVTEEPVILEENVVADENDEVVSIDELDEVDLDEIDDNREALEEKLDQEEFEADDEIEIEEVETIVEKEPVVPKEPVEEDVNTIEETSNINESYEIEQPEIKEDIQQNNNMQYARQNDIAAQNPIKEQPKPVEEERGADVLSSVQIDSNKGFCVTYYNNQLILIGYIGENIFLIHKFRRGEITNAQIKFRLSDSNLNEDYYMVKVDNSKFMVKVTPNAMALELLV